MKRWQKGLLIALAIVAFVIFVLPFLIPLPPDGVDPAVYADDDGQFMTVNGLQTYVRERGEPGEPVVLLLHGWGGSTFSWREQIDALDEAGYRVIAFDRPPHGLSQKTGDLPLSQTEQAAFTVALMDELGIDRATLVGHSMGGGVIGYLAAEHPERVDALVFVDGAPPIAEASSTQTMTSADSRMGIPSGVTGVLEFAPFNRWARILMRTFLQPEAFTGLQSSAYYNQAVVTPEVAEGYQRQLKVVGWDEALIAILAGGTFADAPISPEALSQLTVPVLITWGEHDTWVPIERGQQLADALNGETFITFPSSGHLPMEEEPVSFTADLIAFLNANLGQDAT